ncbi:hypothetical protein CLOP_g2192 [Closterium sp. NIES-67]|nr:hypothetical protein CLOP_g2192 [Closterium sp. NIES-67]
MFDGYRHHIMHLLPEIDCGPKAWAVLKDLHAPTSVAASLMLDRELSMLRLSENEPVQPVLDKMRELYAKLAIAGITYPEQTKYPCTDMGINKEGVGSSKGGIWSPGGVQCS